MSAPSPEIVARMEALVRHMSVDAANMVAMAPLIDTALATAYAEARAIAALLPKPVDPDVLACREIADAYERAFVTPHADSRRGALEKALLEAYRAGKSAS